MNHYQVQLVVLNASMRDSMSKILHIDSTKILSNGVDSPEYSKQYDRDDMCVELNIPQNAFLVIHVG